jgi:hypothetical protein
VGEREDGMNRVGQHEIWDALMRIRPGEVGRALGVVVVRRLDAWEFEVNGEPGRLLLPALDRVMTVAGFRVLQEVRP